MKNIQKKKKTVNKKSTKTKVAKSVRKKKVVRKSLPPAIIKADEVWKSVESVLIHGDLSKLTDQQRVHYYQATCKSMGLNPLTRPFDYLIIDEKLVLYARANATDQLRKIHNVTISKVENLSTDDTIRFRVYVSDTTGRQDTSMASVSKYTKHGLAKGKELSNLEMKCETKAKRRATLSFVSTGMLDESEIDSVVGIRFATVSKDGKIENISKPQGEDADGWRKYKKELNKMFKENLDAKPTMERLVALNYSRTTIVLEFCLKNKFNWKKIKPIIENEIENQVIDAEVIK